MSNNQNSFYSTDSQQIYKTKQVDRVSLPGDKTLEKHCPDIKNIYFAWYVVMIR